MFLNHSMTESLFLHCITLLADTILLLIRSRITILISGLAGLMRRDVGLLSKFGLWSFNVIKHTFSAIESILLSSLRSFAIFLSSFMISAVLFAVIHQAAVTNKATKEVQTYIGLTENTFKTCYLKHTSSFRNKTKRNATELSKYIWKLKDSNTLYTINWKIIKKSQPSTKPNAVP